MNLCSLNPHCDQTIVTVVAAMFCADVVFHHEAEIILTSDVIVFLVCVGVACGESLFFLLYGLGERTGVIELCFQKTRALPVLAL